MTSSRTPIRGLVAAGLTLALCPAVLPAASAREDGMEFGARVEAEPDETEQAALLRREATVGRPMDVVREFLHWDNGFPSSFHTWLEDTDRTMLLSVRPRRSDGSLVRWADIAAAQSGGALYADIVRWADRLRAFPDPLYFTLNHEPESRVNAQMGTASEFIAAWRRVRDIFVARGATNVKFLWIMTDYAFFVGSQAPNDAAKWYPGDGYVEALGADAYNWYTCRDGVNTPWWSLEQIIEPFRDFGARHPDEELWLPEYASTEDPAQPGRKAAWLADARALFKRPDYAQFVGISYFDYQGPDRCQWEVDSSASSLAAFRALGQDPFYRGPGAAPATPGIGLVGTAGANGNRTSHTVEVPATVRAGDTLLLYYTANQNLGAVAAPAGWTTRGAVDSAGLLGRVWTRTATAADAGSTITVDSPAIVKADLLLAAYRGATAVDAVAIDAGTTVSTTHQAPSVTPTASGTRVVVYWGDKSTTNADHVVGGTPTERVASSTGDGGGHITASLADLVAGAQGTPTGPFVATGTGPASGAVTVTIALR